MSATNQNQETDSLRIIQNKDGSYTCEWNKEDPNWKWMNNLTSKEIQVIMQQAIQEDLKNR
jgi:glutathione synthase/RimK-type ligase-like ATP-grasp enzyme